MTRSLTDTPPATEDDALTAWCRTHGFWVTMHYFSDDDGATGWTVDINTRTFDASYAGSGPTRAAALTAAIERACDRLCIAPPELPTPDPADARIVAAAVALMATLADDVPYWAYTAAWDELMAAVRARGTR